MNIAISRNDERIRTRGYFGKAVKQTGELKLRAGRQFCVWTNDIFLTIPEDFLQLIQGRLP